MKLLLFIALFETLTALTYRTGEAEEVVITVCEDRVLIGTETAYLSKTVLPGGEIVLEEFRGYKYVNYILIDERGLWIGEINDLGQPCRKLEYYHFIK